MTSKIDLNAIVQELGPLFAEGADERDRDATFVAEHFDRLKAREVFSAQVPIELGGGGASHSEMCTFIRTLARYCGSTALAHSMHQHQVSAAVFNYRAGKGGQPLLEKVAASQAVIISTGGNDWLESNGEAVRVEGGYRVTARKPFASGSPAGDILSTTAPYEDPEEGWQVLHFPIPFTAEGVSLGGDWDTHGMRATGSETVILDNVFVPEDKITLRRPRSGFHPAFNLVAAAALPAIVSAYAGVAESAAEIAIRMAGKKADDPATPILLGEMINHLTTAQLACDSMVSLANDLDIALVPETADGILVRKTIAAKAVIATVEKALEAAGGAGFYRKLGIERLLRDIHAVQFHPLPEKRQQLFSGRMALGLEPVPSLGKPELRVAAE